MKKIATFLLAIIAALLCSCADKTELEQRSFVTTIGIDGENGKFKLTVSFANAAAMVVGSGGGEEKQTVKTESGETLTECIKKIDDHTARKLYFGHLKAIVFGDSADVKTVAGQLSSNDEFHREAPSGVYALRAENAEAAIGEKYDEGSLGLYAAHYYKNNKNARGITFDEIERKTSNGESADITGIKTLTGEQKSIDTK